jgi:hypothetical protein
MKGLRKTLTERKLEKKRKLVVTEEEDSAKKVKVITEKNSVKAIG